MGDATLFVRMATFDLQAVRWPRRRRLTAVVLWLLLSISAYADSTLRVDLFTGAANASQTAFLAAFEKGLAKNQAPDVKIRRRSIEEIDRPAAGPEADLRIAIGATAAESLARSEGPIPRLYGFIPRSVWQRVKACCVRPDSAVSALFLDRPPIQYLQLAQGISPSAKQVGVLLGPVSKSAETELRRAAAQVGVGLSLAWVKTREDVGPALRRLLDDVDVLVALPDPTVFNAQTIYPVLLTSYSARLPVIAYSNAMVRAGAAAAVLISPQDAGRDLAAETLRFAVTRQLRTARSSPSLSIRSNQDVLRSLGIESIDTDLILRRLREAQL